MDCICDAFLNLLYLYWIIPFLCHVLNVSLMGYIHFFPLYSTISYPTIMSYEHKNANLLMYSNLMVSFCILNHTGYSKRFYSKWSCELGIRNAYIRLLTAGTLSNYSVLTHTSYGKMKNEEWKMKNDWLLLELVLFYVFTVRWYWVEI